MSSLWANLLVLALTFVIVGAASLLVRRLVQHREPHYGSWGATLSYIAAAYGVIVGFSILFLFGQYASARDAVGNEATSIGTAFDQATLFPQSQPSIQRALICYARAVPAYDWPAMAAHEGGSAKVDAAYQTLVASVGVGDRPSTGALQAATATNLVSQIGNISTARETRLVAAETRVPTMLWILLIGGGAFAVLLLFAVTMPARGPTQAVLVAMSAVFTVVMLLVVIALAEPFGTGGGRVTPQLINETAASMTSAATPAVGAPCALDRQ